MQDTLLSTILSRPPPGEIDQTGRRGKRDGTFKYGFEVGCGNNAATNTVSL
jgi:hypothetical protein